MPKTRHGFPGGIMLQGVEFDHLRDCGARRSPPRAPRAGRERRMALRRALGYPVPDSFRSQRGYLCITFDTHQSRARCECPSMMTRLDGHKLMRIAFLDESGRSRQEPKIVVAGILIHGDRTYRKLEEALRTIAVEDLP